MLLILLGLSGGAALALLTYLASRWFLWGALLLMLCMAKKALTHEISPLTGSLYLEDGVAAVLMAAGIVRFVLLAALSGQKVRGSVALALACGAAFLAAVAQSVVRSFVAELPVIYYTFHTLALYTGGLCYGLSWFAAPRGTVLRQLSRAYVLPALFVAAVIVARLAFGPQALWLGRRAPQWVSFRVVGSDEALLLLEALLVCLAPVFLKGEALRARWALLAGVAAVLLLVLGHRSVWAAAIAALLWLGWASKRRALLLGAVALLAVLPAAWLLAPEDAPGAGVELRQHLATAVAEPLSAKSTLRWRVQGWESYLRVQAEQGALGVLFGAPVGTDYYYAAGASRHTSPHNWYVQVCAYFGLVGTLCWLLLFVTGLFNLRRPAAEAQVLGALCLVCGVFYVAYGVSPTHGLILGLSAAACGEASGAPAEGIADARLGVAHLPQPAG
jgi:hypothetical protein